ncbi:fluoride efflux transporter CrcB [Rhodococcus sp. HNM0569]|nr:fluoride efflux transporter CrcB [Rhodococcus sp. HNM0569]
MLVCAAGSAGAVCRFMVDGVVKARVGARFPWGTLAVNVSGSLVLGVVTGIVVFHDAAPQWQQVLGVGFCGGYTTFSTASFESVRLVQQGRAAAGAANVFGSVAVTAAAAAIGLSTDAVAL